MRRTASEMINDLEHRVARLESKNAFFGPFKKKDKIDELVDLILKTQGVELNKIKRKEITMNTTWVEGRFVNGVEFFIAHKFHPIDVDMGSVEVTFNGRRVYRQFYKNGLADFLKNGDFKKIRPFK